METLFSLEVIINYVKLNSSAASCLFPCVAFRLLDYPTIAINLLDDYDANDIKTKFQLEASFEHIEKLPCFTELLDKHGRYIFSRGKSCLFRSDLEVLRGHLKSTPMYLMLLDTFFKPFKLIGTALVPMFNLINEIYNDKTINDNDSPNMKMSHGIFEIKNLLGEELGHVSFACRLSSFGASLMPHIETTVTEAFQRKFKSEKKSVEILKKEEIENNEVKDEILVYKLTKQVAKKSDKQNAIVQTVKIDYQDAQIQINENIPETSEKSIEVPNKLPIDKKLETPAIKPANIYTIKHIAEENAFDHYSPPALHYNSINDKSNKIKIDSATVNQQILNKNKYLNQRLQYLSNAAATHLEDEFSDEISNEKIIENEIQLKDYFVENKKNALNKLNLDQMPLLKCLFDEMNLIKNMLENKTEPIEKPVSKNLVSILKPKPKSKPTKIIKRGAVINSVNRLSAQPMRQINKKIEIKSNNPYDEIPVGPKKEPKQTKKAPLQYGTTNTHRMRVLANNPKSMNEIDQKHEALMSQIKENISELSLTVKSQSFNESNNLEKVLFESTVGSNMSGLMTTTTTAPMKTTMNKTMNLSLLNKVDLDSTNDNTINKTRNEMKSNNDYTNIQPTKVVQFGNTYVLNTSFGPNSEESGGKMSQLNSASEASLQAKSNNEESTKEDNSYFNRNIFLENNPYNDDFHSSLDSSIISTKQSNSTASNFFTERKKKEMKRQSSIQESFDDYYDEDLNKSLSELDMEYLKNVNYSDLNKSLSKYSSSEYNIKSFIDESLSNSRTSSKS